MKTRSARTADKSDALATVSLVFEKSTKGAHRFAEVNDRDEVVDLRDATIGTLYLRKSAVGDRVPMRITVTIRST